jgi:hypothetical protein
MQTEPVADARGNNGQQRALRNRQAGRVTGRGVLVVLRRGRGDDEVVAVVAASQEHADQGLVVDSLGERVDQAETLHPGDERGRPERIANARVGRLKEKFPARDVHGYLST